MMFGNNAKIVLKILTEFLDSEKNIELKSDSEEENTLSGINKFTYTLTLRVIAEDFLLKAEFNPKKLFDLIVDDYNSSRGIYRFIGYRKTLQEEKSKGFQTLKEISNTVREKMELAQLRKLQVKTSDT